MRALLSLALAAASVLPAAAQALIGDAPPPTPRHATLGREGLVLHDPGFVRRLAPPGEVETFGFDRDGAALLATRGRELTRIALDGRRRDVLLTAPGEVRFPDASPRDGALAFSLSDGERARDARWRVAMVDAAGGGLRVLADGYDPCFSPCGRYLVFEATHEDVTDLFELDLDAPDAAPRRLLAESEASRHTPYVTPDGAQVLFTAERRLHAAPRFGVGEVVALTPPGAYDRFVSASPDGRTLLFFRQADERDLLVLRAADGSERHALGSGARLAAFAPAPPAPGSVAARVRALAGESLELADVTALAPAEAMHLAAASGLRRLALPRLTRLDGTAARELARARLAVVELSAGAEVAPDARAALEAAGVALVVTGQ